MNNNPNPRINLTEQSDRDLFVPVYLNFLHSNKLTGKEKLIYICLKSFLAVGSDNGQVFPSIPTICEMVNMSEPTVTKLLHSLRKKGVLEIKRQGLTKPNLYTLYDRRSLWEDVEEDEIEQPISEIEKAKKLLEAAGYSVTKEESEVHNIEETSQVAVDQQEENVEPIKDTSSDFKSQIAYGELITEDAVDKKIIDTIVDVIDDAMKSDDSIKIGKNEVEKSVFVTEIKKLNKDMILAIISKFKEAKDVKHPKSYLLSMLYHQPGVHDVEQIGKKSEKKDSDIQSKVNKNAFHNYEQRNYDYDEIEAKLLHRKE